MTQDGKPIDSEKVLCYVGTRRASAWAQACRVSLVCGALKLQPQPQQAAPPGSGPKGLSEVAGRRLPHTREARFPRPSGPAYRIRDLLLTVHRASRPRLLSGCSLGSGYISQAILKV